MSRSTYPTSIYLFMFNFSLLVDDAPDNIQLDIIPDVSYDNQSNGRFSTQVIDLYL